LRTFSSEPELQPQADLPSPLNWRFAKPYQPHRYFLGNAGAVDFAQKRRHVFARSLNARPRRAVPDRLPATGNSTDFAGETQIDKKFTSDAKVSAAGELHFVRAESTTSPRSTTSRLCATPAIRASEVSELRRRYKWTGAGSRSASCAWNKRKICFRRGDFCDREKRIDGTFRIGATADV